MFYQAVSWKRRPNGWEHNSALIQTKVKRTLKNGAKTHKSRRHSGQLWLPKSHKQPLTKARQLYQRQQYFILSKTVTLCRELNVRSTVNQTFPPKCWVSVWLHVWVGSHQWLHWHSTFCEVTLMVPHWGRHWWCICPIDMDPSCLLIQGFKLSLNYSCFLSKKWFTHSSQVRYNVSGVWCMMPVVPKQGVLQTNICFYMFTYKTLSRVRLRVGRAFQESFQDNRSLQKNRKSITSMN